MALTLCFRSNFDASQKLGARHENTLHAYGIYAISGEVGLRESLKTVVWEGDALDVLRGFSKEVRDDIGLDLLRLQRGLAPHNARPMKTVGVGAWELRAKDASGQHRAIYVLVVADKVHVLHCFKKKTQKTAKHEIGVAAARYAVLKQRIKDGSES